MIPTTSKSRWTWPALWTALWALLWLLLAGVLVYRATTRRESRGVILDHLEFGRRLALGEDVYGPWMSDPDAPIRPLHAPYPPSFGLLTAPFAGVDALFGTAAARAAWALMQVGCLLATALWLRRLSAVRAPPGGPRSAVAWHWLWLGMFLLGSRFVLRDLHGGGGNTVNLALCVGAFALAEGDRPRTAGLLLGFSLATKPTQLWLLPVLLLLGHKRAVGWTVVAGLGAALSALLLQRGDTGPWARWIEGSWRIGTQGDPFAAPAFDFPPFEWMNQSLRCAVARWFGTVPDEFAAKVAWGVPPGLQLADGTVRAIAAGLSLLLLAAVLATARSVRSNAAGRQWVFAAALVLSVLLSPLSWKAHHVALLPVLLLLVQRAWHAPPGQRWRGFLLLSGWALCCVPGRDLVGDAADEWMNSLYVITAWDVALLLLSLAAARTAALEDRDAAPPAGIDERRR